MQRIVKRCKDLKAVKIRGKTRVMTFEAASSEIPFPDTWGEIALLKAREIAGTFYPKNRIWLKIRFGKKLLGQAFLEKDYYRGEDKSDLPQTKSRDSINMCQEWHDEVATIHRELPPDFQVTQVELPDLPEGSSDVTFKEHFVLLQMAREHDLQELARLNDYERNMALQRSQYSKSRQVLDERIERCYHSATTDAPGN